LFWFNPVGRREVKGKGDVKIALLEGVLLGGHALSLDDLDITRLDNLTGSNLDQQFAVVKVGDHELASSQRGRQGDVLLHDQVTFLAGENSYKKKTGQRSQHEKHQGLNRGGKRQWTHREASPQAQ